MKTMDSDVAVVGKYKDQDVWLIPKGSTWYISFGSVDNQQYWLEALNRILAKYPEYKFTTEQGFEVDMNELKTLIQRINDLVAII